MNPLPRPEAQAVVDSVTVKVRQYKAVPLALARDVLGKERYDAMMRDKLRSTGPEEMYVYSWHVVDYLDAAGPFKGASA